MYAKYHELLRKMVSTPSLSYHEAEVAEAVGHFLLQEGIDYALENGNILALNKFFSPLKPTLALVAHLDTVPASESYSRDPFDPGNEDGIIRGLGSNDDGGSVVSMIATFRHFYDKTPAVNLMLVLTREEECSGPDGSSYLFRPGDGFFEKSELFPMPEYAIVGEPTGMRVASSERGLLVLDGEAHGVSGHAARGEGVNAIYKAISDIEALKGHEFSKRSPIMGDVRLSVTQISAGTAHNVIPDSCRFVVDIRPTDCYTPQEILSELQGLVESTLKARNLRNRSSATKADSPLLKTAGTLGLQTFSSPTTSDWIRIGCDAIKMGAGDSSRSHKADEYILTSEIDEAIEIYTKFIDNFYGNTLE